MIESISRRQKHLQTMWDGRATTWHRQVENSDNFLRIRNQLLALARVSAEDDVVDLGAGSGFVALAIAPRVKSVIAIDLSEEMLAILNLESSAASLSDKIGCMKADLATIDLPPNSVDVVVSCYALHHLNDASKRLLLKRIRAWIRPGGRIVIADMMFGRGRTAHDRRIIYHKVRGMLSKGVPGVWRLMRNMVRFGFRRGSELPASPSFWVEALKDADFSDVTYSPLIAEAGLVSGAAAGP